MFADCYQGMHLPSHDHCISMLLHVTLFPPQGYSSWMDYRLCLHHLCLVSPSFLWLGFLQCLLSNCSCCSLLKDAHPEWLPDRVPVDPGVSPSSSSSWCGQKFWEWSKILHFRLLFCVPLLLLFRRSTPPQCPVTHFSNPVGSPDCSLHDLQPNGFPKDPARCPLTLQM
jgi:hypothetical protein